MTCKSVSTPIDPNYKLGKAEKDVVVDREIYQRLAGKLISFSHIRHHKLGEVEKDVVVDREIYQCLVGKLISLSHIRPDIAYTVRVIN